MRLTRAVPVVLATAALAATAIIGPTVSAAPSGRATLAGSVPSWATSSNFKGTAPDSDSVGFRVYLGWTDQAGAEALARSVSDPRSSSYGKYLTPAQFRQRFSPSQSSVGAVQSWLRSQLCTVATDCWDGANRWRNWAGVRYCP